MPTENTSLKNTAPAGDSNTTNEMVIGKNNTYQRTFLIVAGSLLALLVVIAVADTSGGQHLQSSAHEIAEGVVALVDYQVDSAKLALTKDIFGLDAVSQNDKNATCEDSKHLPYTCDSCYCCHRKSCGFGVRCNPKSCDCYDGDGKSVSGGCQPCYSGFWCDGTPLSF